MHVPVVVLVPGCSWSKRVWYGVPTSFPRGCRSAPTRWPLRPTTLVAYRVTFYEIYEKAIQLSTLRLELPIHTLLAESTTEYSEHAAQKTTQPQAIPAIRHQNAPPPYENTQREIRYLAAHSPFHASTTVTSSPHFQGVTVCAR